MIYAFIASFVIGCLGGFATAHQFDAAKILTLETAIERGNIQAEIDLSIAQVEAAHNAEKAEKLNQQIEVAHAQSIETANALTDRVAAAARLYASRSNCQNAVSGGNSSGSIDGESADRLSREIGELAGEIKRADVYAQSCWQFVSANCGIAHDGPLLPD